MAKVNRKTVLVRDKANLIIEEISNDSCSVVISGGSLDGSEFETETGYTETIAWYLNQGYKPCDISHFLYNVAQLSASGQNELLKEIAQFCTVEEVTALAVGIAYFRQLIDKDLHDHMQAELCKAFLESVK